MKAKDIQDFELGENCFGPILKVNGTHYEDLNKEDVLEFVTDMLLNDINSGNLLMETFKNSLEYLQYDCVESHSDHCDQCGNYNNYSKHAIED